jgi:hypothetical protein
MKRTWHYVVVPAALVLWAAIGIARPNGSPASRTGAAAVGGGAAEASCAGCHGDFAVNSGGSVSLLGVPGFFRGGQTYRLTVRVASTQTTGFSTRNWGFQMTAVDTATGLGAGTFSVVNAAQTGIVNGSGSFPTRRYVNQLTGGLKAGAASPGEWLVDWTAPTAGATRVRFFVAGLAGDGDGSEGGDWVYTASAAATDTVTAALPRTWGSVKSAYVK